MEQANNTFKDIKHLFLQDSRVLISYLETFPELQQEAISFFNTLRFKALRIVAPSIIKYYKIAKLGVKSIEDIEILKQEIIEVAKELQSRYVNFSFLKDSPEELQYLFYWNCTHITMYNAQDFKYLIKFQNLHKITCLCVRPKEEWLNKYPHIKTALNRKL